MSKLIDTFLSAMVVIASLLIVLALSGVSAGQDYEKKGTRDDEPEMTREEAKARAWADPDFLYAHHKSLTTGTNLFRTIADGKAAAKKVNKPYMIFAGKDSLTSRAGRLLADEFVDKAVLIYLEKGFGNETDAIGSRLLFMDKSGGGRFVSMCDCTGETAAAIDKGMAQKFVDGASVTTTKTIAQVKIRDAKGALSLPIMASPVRRQAARPAARPARLSGG